MKRGMLPIILLAMAVVLSSLPASAQERFPVSVGISFGRYTPSMDAYNLRFVDQANPNLVDIGGGQFVTIRIRQSIDSTTTFFPQTRQEFVSGKESFLFSSAWGLGLNAKVRLHSELYALVEYDWWSQKVAHRRNFGGLVGYESYDVSLNPATASIVYELPTEIGNPWWPKLYVGGGAGVMLVDRTTTQITNQTPPGGAKSTASGSGLVLTGIAGMEYPFFFINNRASLFIEGRYLSGDYPEQFVAVNNAGSPLVDANGDQVREDVAVSIQGPQLKFGVTMNFGQIRTRPQRGVLSGLIEERSRRSTGYAMAPTMYGGAAPGMAMMYAQPTEQIQVVQGAGQIDENRIRQIIREELVTTRVSTGDARLAPVDDLAEQQLRNIRERRLQAEAELEQLKDLLREEG